MKNARTALLAATAAVLLSGCISMTPATYMVSPDIKQTLKQYDGSKLQVSQIEGPADFNAMCRAVGNVQIENGLSVPQFIQKSYNDELKFAGLHAENGVQLKGKLTRVEFSSSASLVNGYWDLALSLASSNGKSMNVETRHDFESGFNGATACNNTSQALAQAAQALVRKTVADPRFGTLIR
jgi:PBP1b-binding outer membrane lipoprotein LpoB